MTTPNRRDWIEEADRAWVRAAGKMSEESFSRAWDNKEDAVYDDYPPRSWPRRALDWVRGRGRR